MEKVCTVCQISFPVHERDLKFYAAISPIIQEQKFALPTPSHCPECRLKRRLLWRNETTLYLRKSDFTGQDIISIYSPEKSNKIYELKQYEHLDLMNWGKTIDPHKSIFRQFTDFFRQVPLQALNNMGENESSEYCNYGYQCQNCYLCFWGDVSQDSLYNYGFVNLKDCVDNYWLFDGELCYENVNTFTAFNSKYIYNCHNCSDSAFLFSCRDVKHSMFCVNLQHKEYCLFNEQLTKEEFGRRKAEFDFGSFTAVQKMYTEFNAFKAKFPVRNLTNINVENVTGDMNQQSQNCFDCYHMLESQDCSYGIDHIKNKDVYDSYGCVELEQCYDVHCGLQSQRVLFSYDIYTSYNLLYCISCRSCKDCFGCVGLRNKQYCIFNTQHSQAEYEKLLSEILTRMIADGEWGEFFPESASPFGYNESTANEYFPHTKTEALARDYPWTEYEAPKPEAKNSIAAQDLPDHIRDVSDEILNSVIACANTGRLFRLTKQELAFYRAHNIPLPRYHSDERRRQRMLLKNPRSIRTANCDSCKKEMLTSVPAEHKSIVYCEDCFLAVRN